MPRVPNRLYHMPGELFPTWLIRETKACGFDRSVDFMRSFAWISSGDLRWKHVRLNDADFVKFFKVMNDTRLLKPSELSQYRSVSEEPHKVGTDMRLMPSELFRDSSVYAGMAPFMTRAEQTAYINSVFLPNDPVWNEFRTDPRPMFKELRYCPECAREEEDTAGFHWYHADLQLPGIRVCPKHGCLLMSSEVKQDATFNNPDMTASLSMENADHDTMHAYSRFMTELWAAFPDTDLREVCTVMSNQIRTAGYSGHAELDAAIQKSSFKTLLTKPIERIISMAHFTSRLAIPDLAALLLFLFGDADHFIKALPKYDNSAFLDLVSTEGCSTLSHYHRSLLEMKHDKCGTDFICTAAGFENGFRCPSCEMKDTPAALYEAIVASSGNGEYQVLEPFQSLQISSEISHSCGRKYRIRPYEFLYQGVRCSCGNKLTAEEINRRLSKYGDYTFTERDGDTISIRHDTCGREFTCYLSNFLRFPFCRACKEAKVSLANAKKVPKKMRMLPPSRSGWDENGRMNADGLYWKILCDRHDHDLIIVHDYVQEPYRLKNISDRFSILVKRGLLKRLADGVYCFPGSGLKTDDVIRMRYMCDGSRVFGYFSAAPFAYSLGLLQTKPKNTYITTNVQTGSHPISFKGYGTRIELSHPKTEITRQNAKILQLLDLLANLKRYSELPCRETLLILHAYADKANISVEMAIPYLRSYEDVVTRRLQELLIVPAHPYWKKQWHPPVNNADNHKGANDTKQDNTS